VVEYRGMDEDCQPCGLIILDVVSI
jgi:hypothetical protein